MISFSSAWGELITMCPRTAGYRDAKAQRTGIVPSPMKRSNREKQLKYDWAGIIAHLGLRGIRLSPPSVKPVPQTSRINDLASHL